MVQAHIVICLASFGNAYEEEIVHEKCLEYLKQSQKETHQNMEKFKQPWIPLVSSLNAWAKQNWLVHFLFSLEPNEEHLLSLSMNFGSWKMVEK